MFTRQYLKDIFINGWSLSKWQTLQLFNHINLASVAANLANDVLPDYFTSDFIATSERFEVAVVKAFGMWLYVVFVNLVGRQRRIHGWVPWNENLIEWLVLLSEHVLSPNWMRLVMTIRVVLLRHWNIESRIVFFSWVACRIILGRTIFLHFFFEAIYG